MRKITDINEFYKMIKSGVVAKALGEDADDLMPIPCMYERYYIKHKIARTQTGNDADGYYEINRYKFYSCKPNGTDWYEITEDEYNEAWEDCERKGLYAIEDPVGLDDDEE